MRVPGSRPELPPDRSRRTTLRSAAAVCGLVSLAAAAVPVAASAGPPPGRAYELVSPVDDPSGAIGGLSTDFWPLPGITSDDGDRVLYGAGSALGPTLSGASNAMTFGKRTATGWEARTAIRSLDHGDTPLEAPGSQAQSGRLMPDGSSFVFGASGNLGAVPYVPGKTMSGVYRSSDADSLPDWLSRPAEGVPPLMSPPVSGIMGVSTSSSRDGETVAFNSDAPLTPDAPAAGTSAVYAVHGGRLQLVSRLPDGSVPTALSSIANTSNANAGAQNPPAVAQRNQVAGNGRFVFFRVGGTGSGGPLYVRDLAVGVTRQLAGGAPGVTENAVPLSASWGVAGQTVAVDVVTVPSDSLVFAASDGARAYFKGFRSGTATAAFLYEANLETGAVTARPAITGAPLGLSPDGERMLFLQPPAGASTASGAGDWTLRYWDRSDPGNSSVVGTINLASRSPTFGLARVFRSSKDGKSWIFTAIGSPDPMRPNVGAATQQLYRWTVGQPSPTCLTCHSTDGVARTSGVNLTVQESIATEKFFTPTTGATPGETAFGLSKRNLSQPGHSVSDDGRLILFDSPDRLVTGDTNSVRDVYLWDRDAASGGELQLVTSGQGNTPSYALDLDPTGRNAFFTTREGLVPADNNGSYNVYVARVGGGFPGSGESCAGEACRPAVIPDPPTELVGSGALTDAPAGAQRLAQQGSPVLRVRSVRSSVSRLTVRVDTPRAGRIRISGSRVKTTSRSVKRAATYSVRVPLSASAKRLVARGRTVKVSLRVVFTPSGSKKAQRVSSSVSVRKGR